MKNKFVTYKNVVFLLLVVLLSACGGASSTGETSMVDEAAEAEEATEPNVEEAVEKPAPRIGIFVENAFGDKGFYDIAAAEIPDLEENYGAVVTTYEGHLTAENYKPILKEAASSNDLVFAMGYTQVDALLEVAMESPDTIFILLDVPEFSDDIVTFTYKDYEGCFIDGALAAAVTTDTTIKNVNTDKIIGYVAGGDNPITQKCLTGFEQGAAYVDPDVEVQVVFVGSWIDPAKSKEANLALIEKGVDVILEWAGAGNQACYELGAEGEPILFIGSGFDQRWMAPDYIIGSTLKGVDTSIDYLTGLYLKDELNRGQSFDWGIVEGVLPTVMSEDMLPASIVEQIRDIETKIQSGDIDITN